MNIDNFDNLEQDNEIENEQNKNEQDFDNDTLIEQEIQKKVDIKPKTSILSEVFDWVESIAVSVVIVVLLFTFVFRIVGVVGESMENTLKTNDKLIISNLFYKPNIGDVIVFIPDLEQYENKPFVKRIIALEGQKVDINEQTGEVFVDDKLIQEDYIKTPTYNKGTQSYPVIVEKGKVFVMGDNRGNSTDSRYETVGTVDTRAIIGRCLIRVFPFNKIGELNK
ncbi:MAG: signal peptidase I [Clostridia bacterium]